MFGMIKIEPLSKTEKHIIDIICKTMHNMCVRRNGGCVYGVDHVKIIFGKTKVYHRTLADCAAILYAMCRLLRDGSKVSDKESTIAKTSLSCIELIEDLVLNWNRLLRIYNNQLYNKKERIDIFNGEEVR